MRYIVTNSQTDTTSSHKSLVTAKEAAQKIFQCSLFESNRDICESLELNDSAIVTPILSYMNTQNQYVIIDRIK